MTLSTATTTAVFTPADSNAFYHYTEDTPLYVLVDNVAGGNQKLLTHQEALDHLLQSTVIPERETVVIDGTTYNIVRAQEAHKGQAPPSSMSTGIIRRKHRGRGRA